MTKIQTPPVHLPHLNMEAKTGQTFLVLTDVHEHSIQFFEMLEKYPISEERKLIVTGDIIDKGLGYPAFSAIATKIKELSDQGLAYLIRGNHEVKRIKRAIREKSMDENMEWISKQPLIYSFIYPSQKRYTFVHGGITPRMTWEKISNDIDLVYCRAIGKFGKSVSTFFNKETGQWEFREPDVIVWHELYNGRFGYVVSGHAPLKNGEPKFYKNSCNIDTACFITGKLTGLLLSENSMEHVQIHGPAAQPSDLPD